MSTLVFTSLSERSDCFRTVGNDVAEWAGCVDDFVGDRRQVVTQFCFSPVRRCANEIVFIGAVGDAVQSQLFVCTKKEQAGGGGGSNAG